MSSAIDRVREALQGRSIPVAVVGLLLSSAVLWALFTVDYDECGDDEDCIRIAYEVKDTYLFWDAHPQEMADKLSELTGEKVVVEAHTKEVKGLTINDFIVATKIEADEEIAGMIVKKAKAVRNWI